MEMFNKKELDKRIGPLRKNDSLYQLEQVEGMSLENAKKKA